MADTPCIVRGKCNILSYRPHLHLDDISGEKYALYFHNLLLENVDDLPFISFYNDFSVSLENSWSATLCTVVMVVAMDATIARPRL